MKTCFVSNLSEDVWPFIQAQPAAIQATEIGENQQLSDRDIFAFSGQNEVLFILPQQLDPDFWRYYQTTFGCTKSQVLVPQHHTGQTCADVLRDTALLKKMVTWATDEPLALYSYSPSVEFFQLVQTLRDMGVTVECPESPPLDKMSAIEELGTKTGIRKSALPVVEGEVFADWKRAVPLAAKWWYERGAVVLKTRKGHSGFGVMILTAQDRPSTLAECRRVIKDKLQAESFWAQFPLVVEEFITTDTTVGGGFPSVEYRIMANGKPEYLYACGMRVTAAGVFRGIIIGAEIFTPQVLAVLQHIGLRWGLQLAGAGYRGYYDVDCLAGIDGRMYASESNVRRTGGTHVYATAKTLLGPDFYTTAVTLSQNMGEVPGKRVMTFPQLLDRLQSLLFDPATRQGIVITSANLLPGGRFGYVVLGHDYNEAVAIEEKMFAALTA
jgi:hypothetical protein